MHDGLYLASVDLTYTLGQDSALPQNPWTVPVGDYIRTDGSKVHIPEKSQLPESTVYVAGNDSMECLVGGDTRSHVENAEVQA